MAPTQSQGGSSDHSQGAGEVSYRGSSGRGPQAGAPADPSVNLNAAHLPQPPPTSRSALNPAGSAASGPPAATVTLPWEVGQSSRSSSRNLPLHWLEHRSDLLLTARGGGCCLALWLAPRLGAGLTFSMDCSARGRGRAAPALTSISITPGSWLSAAVHSAWRTQISVLMTFYPPVKHFPNLDEVSGQTLSSRNAKVAC